MLPRVTVDGLSPTDPGVRLLARAIADVPGRRRWLLFCGPGGLAAPGARRTVLDVRERPVAGEVLELPATDAAPTASGGPEDVDTAVHWPRAHLGLDFARQALARAAVGLPPGGTLWLAARRDKGAQRLEDHVRQLFGDAQRVAHDSGYRLVRARRGDTIDVELARGDLERRWEFTDPDLPGLTLRGRPGVFSRRGLDDATRALLAFLRDTAIDDPARRDPECVVDLGAGLGPLAIMAARRWPAARVVGIESNLCAVRSLEENVAGAGCNVEVRAADVSAGLPDLASRAQLVLTNPPTHAAPDELRAFLAAGRELLVSGGRLLAVVMRRGVLPVIAPLGAWREHAVGAFTVLELRRS
jgi:16S rRNA G1207 methylase RsmC